MSDFLDSFNEPFHIFAFYTAINALIMLILSILVVRARVKTQTSIGDGGLPAMAGPLRAHGNNTEYVPMALLLMWALCPLGASVWLLHGVGLPLVIGRLLHALALTGSTGPTTLRLIGALLTWIAFVVGIIGVLYVVFVPPAPVM